MVLTYKQARKDHEYLWSISEAYDMTGGYVDQEDLKRLLKTPTKAMAAECYVNQIIYWFEKGPDLSCDDRQKRGKPPFYRNDTTVKKIAKRYKCEYDLVKLLS